jgi:hypothetical protein
MVHEASKCSSEPFGRGHGGKATRNDASFGYMSLLYLSSINKREHQQAMSHIGFTANVYAIVDIMEGNAEASAPKRRCKGGSTQSDFDLLSSDLAESECRIPQVLGWSKRDLNDCEHVDSSLVVSSGSIQDDTAISECHYEPTRTLRNDPTCAIPPRPPKRFPRAMWRGLIRRAVAHSIALHL